MTRVRRVAISGRTDGGTPRNLVVGGLNSDGQAVQQTRTGPKGIVGIALRSRFDYPARGLSTLPSQQIRRIGFGPFLDDDGNPLEYPIVFAYQAEIMRGYSGARFRPRYAVTRGAAAYFLWRTFKVPRAPDGKDYYNDDDGHWAEPAINALAHAGIARGKQYQPNELMLRGALATYLSRLGSVARPRAYFEGHEDDRINRAQMANVLYTIVERYR
jgi:hypothetical protein